MSTPGVGSSVVGRAIHELDTPVLLVDRDVLEHNITSIAGTIGGAGVRWRPHVKAIKTPELVHRLLRAGAQGITVAKVAEAEVMAAEGVDDILIANQIVGAEKLARLAAVARSIRVLVAVDAPEHVRALGAAMRASGVSLDVLVEVDVGLRRCGTRPGRETVELAREVDAEPALRFAGLMGWEGHAAGIADPDEKARSIREAVGLLTGTADACRAEGLDVSVVSCGGTGTYALTTHVPGVTEIQAGGGVFSDVRYRTKSFVDLPIALSVLTTVISRPTATRVVCDAGRKSMSDDYAAPMPLGLGDVQTLKLSAEHATIELTESAERPRIGDRVRFAAGYSDTTVHLHDELLVVSGDTVVEVWPVTARGATR
jgi:D-serine deaminase-like pyridoxal phosphate-dependent protein